MISRAVSLLLASLTVLLLAGCGGSGPASGSSLIFTPQTSAPIVELAAGLPELPADQRLNLHRMTAAAAAATLGREFNQASPDVTVAGDSAELASAANTVSYTLYRFGGVAGEPIESVGYRVSGLDPSERVFLAIGNYSSGTWNYFPLQAAADVTIALSGSVNYQSASGNTWLLLAVYGGDGVAVEEVRVTYTERYTVTGQILDKDGAGIPNVLVASALGGISTRTGTDGSYSLSGLPNGVWPLAASLNGWTFYSQPTFVTIADADAVAPVMIGDAHGARFEAGDLMPNDSFGPDSPLWDFSAGPLVETLSGDDDQLDIYRFNVANNGTYILHYSNQDHNILFPLLALLEYDAYSETDAVSIVSGDVGIAFTVSDAPRELHFAVLSTVGGGEYSVSLLESSPAIFALSIDEGGQFRGGLATVTRSDNGHVTYYPAFVATVPPLTPGQVVLDESMPPGSEITVTAQLQNHDVTPANRTGMLDAALPYQAAFTATLVSGGDSFETNNDFGSAYIIPAIPFDSLPGNPLSVNYSGFADYADYYRFTPAPGAHVRIFVDFDTLGGKHYPIRAAVRDIAFNQYAHSWQTPDGLILELSEPADGGDYHLVIEADYRSNSVLDYSLRLRNYSGSAIRFASRVLPSTLIDGSNFFVYDAAFEARLMLNNNTPDSLTLPIYKAVGTELRVECGRYGTDHDKQTRLATHAASDQIIYFDTDDMGIDSHEPNSHPGLVLNELALPATVNASLGILDDTSDYYRVSPGNGQPFRVTVTTGASGTAFYLALLDSMGNTVTSELVRGPSRTVYLPNDGSFGQKLVFNAAALQETAYTLEIVNAEAYAVSGLVETLGSVPLRGLMKIEGVENVFSSNNGSYELPFLLPAGSYQLECHVPGHIPPVVQQIVNITNADVTVDFDTFTAGPADPYEPNDSRATATPLIAGADYLAFLPVSFEYDYFSYTPVAGDHLRFTLEPAVSWNRRSLSMTRFSSFSEQRAAPYAQGNNLVLDYIATTNQPVYIQLSGSGNYSLRVDVLP